MKLLLGISKGVFHLHSEGVIHRDLAARNILLSADLEPKVGDLGMSRYLCGKEVGQTSSTVGPLKWMAPESILDNVYSPQSDVWSFGVVCWEVITQEEPFPELSALQAASQVLHSGLRLHVPDESICPPTLASLMESCWATEPLKRPSFAVICSLLTQLEKELKGSKEENGKEEEDIEQSPKITASYLQTPTHVFKKPKRFSD